MKRKNNNTSTPCEPAVKPDGETGTGQRRTFTHGEWMAEGVRLFGGDMMQWRFVCPSCGHVASVQDWRDAGATEGEVAFSCVGRHIKGARDAFSSGMSRRPCNYAGGGLFRLNPVQVTFSDRNAVDVFAFATAEGAASDVRNTSSGENAGAQAQDRKSEKLASTVNSDSPDSQEG